MTANELMIGDWVTKKTFHVIKDNEYKSVRMTSSMINTYGIEDSIYPIPLTKEILVANGFSLIKLQYILEYKEQTFAIRVYEDGFAICLSTTVAWLNNVHELQHALRLCGLTEVADNFKV